MSAPVAVVVIVVLAVGLVGALGFDREPVALLVGVLVGFAWVAR